MFNVLIIDDEPDIRNLLARTIQLEGYHTSVAATAKEGLKRMASDTIHVVLTDVKLPDIDGVTLTRLVKEKYPQSEVICLTAYGNINDGVEAIKSGAFDYLIKGDDNNKILPLLEKAAQKADLNYKVSRLREQLTSKFGFEQVIGTSRRIKETISLARKVASTETTVLLTGATGTGKEVFAKAIHYESGRRDHGFVAVNCSAIGKDILESELFGHKAGAFTGAVKDKAGLFEEAHKGTLFLDEIGEMNLDLQAKLLRVLETGAFIKVGATRETTVDVRVIAATNRDVEKEVAEGSFREDLFYRLSVFQISLPALNERLEDLEALIDFFVNTFSAKLGKKIHTVKEDFVKALRNHKWKGNIRELRNVIERGVILCEEGCLDTSLLPFGFTSQNPTSSIPGIYSLSAMEKLHIENVLSHTRGNKTKAAELLGIALTTLYRKLEEYGIEPGNLKSR